MNTKNQPQHNFRNFNLFGFTLVELLVVVAVIGVLTALLLPNLVGIRGRAADSRVKSDLNQLKTVLRLYYNDYQQYPEEMVEADAGCPVLLGCGPEGNSECTPGETFAAAGTTYMAELPEEFCYFQTEGGDSFRASAPLRNVSDPDIEDSQNRCGVEFGEDGPEPFFYVCAD